MKANGEALDQRGFPYPGSAHDQWIVLGPTQEDVHDEVQLTLTSNHGVVIGAQLGHIFRERGNVGRGLGCFGHHGLRIAGFGWNVF